jgi:hypothetical protein
VTPVEQLPFDKIEVQEEGAWRAITLEQWLKTDSMKRIDQIMRGEVQFSLKGQKIPTAAALAALKGRARGS